MKKNLSTKLNLHGVIAKPDHDWIQGQDAVPETVHHVIVMVDPRQEFITLTII